MSVTSYYASQGRKAAPNALSLEEADRVLDAPGLALLLAWRGSQPADGSPPPYAAFDPSAHPRALPGVQLVEIDDAGAFRYRLVGTREAALRGFDPTGRLVSEGFFGVDAEEVLSYYRRAQTERTPILIECDLLTTASRLRVYDISLFLPFAGDDGSVTRVICYSHQPRRP
ncbi:MAG: PAS domain-containing protein [Marivibrio sp.]|uniref:PAS domain-containing protein n=1 Tax=Marivibrio sp. TaxID=2039719 RepID=UPI0032EEA26B